jgi:polysaccharide pyruvyl transferase WcaK-like protein
MTLKNSHPVITLLGNNSGRNLGDAAILSSILEKFQSKLPKVEFLVPSVNPQFISKNYGKKYSVKAVNVLPWTGSLRLLGIPTMHSLKKSDVALICDGIIFGHKLWSVHNFLITLIFLAPWCKAVNCKLICFCCGIGPFPSKLSEKFARFLLNRCDMVVMREEESANLARSIGCTKPIEIRGDIAFLNSVSEASKGKKILKENNVPEATQLIGLNITSYLDSWLKPEQKLDNPDSLVETIARGVSRALDKITTQSPTGIRPYPVLFSCSPMDEEISKRLASYLQGSVIDNSRYLSHDIQAVMRECTVLVGMRFHSLILASSVGVPIIGLIYAPKVRDYMSFLGSSDYSLELSDITQDSLGNLLENAWNNSERLRQDQQKVVGSLRLAAERSVNEVIEEYLEAK